APRTRTSPGVCPACLGQCCLARRRINPSATKKAPQRRISEPVKTAARMSDPVWDTSEPPPSGLWDGLWEAVEVFGLLVGGVLLPGLWVGGGVLLAGLWVGGGVLLPGLWVGGGVLLPGLWVGGGVLLPGAATTVMCAVKVAVLVPAASA